VQDPNAKPLVENGQAVQAPVTEPSKYETADSPMNEVTEQLLDGGTKTNGVKGITGDPRIQQSEEHSQVDDELASLSGLDKTQLQEAPVKKMPEQSVARGAIINEVNGSATKADGVGKDKLNTDSSHLERQKRWVPSDLWIMAARTLDESNRAKLQSMDNTPTGDLGDLSKGGEINSVINQLDDIRKKSKDSGFRTVCIISCSGISR
jgi:hypothetical protein